MAKKNTQATPAAAPTDLSELAMHDTMKINGWDVTRVPGGFIYSRGAAAQFVPISELAAGECGLEFVDLEKEKIQRNLAGN